MMARGCAARHRRHRRVVAAPLLAAGLLATLPPPPLAHAELVGCRSDPVVTLSDGTVLDLSAQISDAVADVQQVVYTLHVPLGTRVVSLVSTDGALGLKESVRITADDLPTTYDTGTAVSTGTAGVAVTATTTVVPLLGPTVGGAASGKDQQTLPIHLTLS